MGSRIKVCYIISNIDKALAFEWIAQHLRDKVELKFILINSGSSELQNFLIEHKVECHHIPYKTKYQSIRVILSLLRLLIQIKPNVIHAHLFEATLFGLFVGKLLGIRNRFYTRHHSTYHHNYFKKGVKYDRIINGLSTGIVAITRNVRNVLIEREHVDPSNVYLIHHGFDLERFQNVDAGQIEKLRNKYRVTDAKIVIGVVARWIEWKGVQYTIQAYQRFLVDNPEAVLLLCNANGPYTSEIQKLLKAIPDKNYRVIEFENDIFALYQLFDLFVHVPINSEIEAFGQTYVEALAAGIPSIVTISGIANEFIEDQHNALVVNYENPDEIYDAMTMLLTDDDLKKVLIANGRKSVEKFSLPNMINNLYDLYCNKTK